MQTTTATNTTHRASDPTGPADERDSGGPGEQTSSAGNESRPAGPGERDAQDASVHRTATVHLPFFTATFEVRRKVPGVAQAAPSPLKVGPVTVPSPTKTAYYLGLGALAVAEVVEWPIAAAIAVGTYVAQHTRSGSRAIPEVSYKGDAGESDQRQEQEHDEPRDTERGETQRGDTELRREERREESARAAVTD